MTHPAIQAHRLAFLRVFLAEANRLDALIGDGEERWIDGVCTTDLMIRSIEYSGRAVQAQLAVAEHGGGGFITIPYVVQMFRS